MIRLVEEVKMKCGGITLAAEDVYMATEFDAFVKKVVMVGRGITGKKEFSYKAVRSANSNVVAYAKKPSYVIIP